MVVVFYGNAEKRGKWPSVRRLSLPCFFLAKVAPREGESMEQQVEEVTAEQPSEEPQTRAEYHLHIKVPNEMRGTLKDAAELAFRMGSIPKPDLVDLMNLFINWGMAVLKRQWLDRVGYR